MTVATLPPPTRAKAMISEDSALLNDGDEKKKAELGFGVDDSVIIMSCHEIGIIQKIGVKSSDVLVRGKIQSIRNSDLNSVDNFISSTNAGERANNYAVDTDYSHDHLNDVYEPEQYRILQNILVQVREAFDEFMIQYPEYSYLKSIDVDKANVGNQIGLINRSGTGEIISTSARVFSVDFGNEVVMADELSIKPTRILVNETRKLGNFFITKAEEYDIKKTVSGFVISNHKKEIKITYEQYKEILPIIEGKIGKGDKVGVVNKKGAGTITDISAGFYRIKMNDDIVTVKRSEIKPVDEYVNRLKAHDISNLYVFIRKNMKDNLFGEMEFFYIFSDYFKLNERTLYTSLPSKIQGDLLTLLRKKLGPSIFSKYGSSSPLW
jgi:hypothetical protein